MSSLLRVKSTLTKGGDGICRYVLWSGNKGSWRASLVVAQMIILTLSIWVIWDICEVFHRSNLSKVRVAMHSLDTVYTPVKADSHAPVCVEVHWRLKLVNLNNSTYMPSLPQIEFQDNKGGDALFRGILISDSDGLHCARF